MRKVLILLDPGIDDSLALMYILMHPEYKVLGIVASYGNVTKQQAIENVAYLLDLAGIKDIPIIAGVTGPLTGELVPYYPEIHGEEGLGPIKPPPNVYAGQEVFDVDKAREIIEKHGNELTIVNLGRLSDLAMLYILYGPEFMNQVKEIYLMGGAFLVPGNVTPVAEANFFADPIAADLVLEKAERVTIFPLNVTNKALLTPEIVEYLTENSKSSYAFLFEPIFDYYFNAYRKLIPGIQGAPIHDLLVVSALANPEIVKTLRRRVRVDPKGEITKGVSIADFRPLPNEESAETLDSIAMEIDYPAFLEDVVGIFLRGQIEQ
ncbi:purine nucleosidase [Bacillus oleivorans]|uniref:Purine nucleosidase n=1 Tax=Bacillus oleivorans TaxID=1448271 RepID=A0A285CLG8_9BACI|nr:nucleoside hydrolase [Bacillus oleivorans]SNX68401.1 purine nucleosidase [Bacillus oleivorans]